MSDAYGNLIPARFALRLLPLSYQQEILVNWLEIEVPTKAPLHGLEELRCWRNREVYTHVKAWDWTAGMFPSPTLNEYERPSIKFIHLRSPRRRHIPLVPRH